MLQLNNVTVSCCQTEQNHYNLPPSAVCAPALAANSLCFNLHPTLCLCDFRISLFRWPMPQETKSASSPEGVLPD